MQTLLHKFCFSDLNKGLLLIDMPTGTGKTHNSIEFIYNNYKQVPNKIIFITNLKKNLPINKLKEFFEKDNRLDDFERDVLFLDNNVDTLIDNFEAVYNDIPENMFNKNGVKYNVKKCIKIINTLKNNLSNKKSKNDNFASKEDAYFMINQAREDLKDKYEKEFREIIEEELKYNENGQKRTKAEKINLIKTDKRFKWIERLYPAVNTDSKKILFMSIDKFLVRNSTIVEPSYEIIDNKSLIANSLIFIDEFDASKDILLKMIINESLDTRVNIVELFRLIYAGIENTTFSKLLTEVSSSLKSKIENNNEKYYTPLEILDEFKTRVEEIQKKYFLVNYHKLEDSQKERANFLFQDYKFHTILSDEKNCVYIDADNKNNINWIRKTDILELSENQNLFGLLQEIKSFLSYFQNGVKFIADNYRNLKKERKQETNNFSYEASIKTVLSEFGIEGKYLNYLTTQIMNTRKNRSHKIVDLKSELDFSVYEKGFRFYNFIDSDTFDTQSKINLLSFNMSPEKILLYLCSNAKVIGISASGTLETVTGNYDLNYVRKKLGDLYYEPTAEDNTRLNKFIDRQLGNYENVKINIDKCPIDDKNYEGIIANLLSAEQSQKIFEKINFYSNNDNFVKARYCKITYSIYNFFRKGIRSFLFLTNVSMNTKLDFNYNCINDIFDILKPSSCTNAYCYALEGSLEKFENLKLSVKQKLKTGKRVFVVSTYQTLGAGQNLQYEYDENFEGLLETINENDYGKHQKDFEALFLDKPTNMFVNMNSNPTEEQLLKFIYQVKCLEENGYYTIDSASKEIKKGIKILYHASTQKVSTPRSKHIYLHTSKIILQAIGRICRTSTKNKNIFISYDKQMEYDLAICKEILFQKKLNFEFIELLNSCENVKEVKDETVFNINNNKIQKNYDKINQLKDFNSVSDITKWEELRDIVLKHPVDNCNIHNEYDIYCELESPGNYYYFNKDANGNFNITYDKYNEKCISEEMANLPKLMAIKEIKDYFIERGYATSFEKSKYILLPNVFTDVYLGALGEVVGEFLVNRCISKCGFELERIRIRERYEKFDFVFDNDKYVDFKFWSNGTNDKDREKEVNRCIKKLNKCDGSKAFIINIFKPENYDPKSYISPDERLIIIPFLYDIQTKTWNLEGLSLLTKNLTLI